MLQHRAIAGAEAAQVRISKSNRKFINVTAETAFARSVRTRLRSTEINDCRYLPEAIEIVVRLTVVGRSVSEFIDTEI
jgi:hypothetical protein